MLSSTVAAGKGTQRVLYRCFWTVQTTRVEASALFDKSPDSQSVKLFVKLGRNCDNQCLHLVDGLSTGNYG